MRRILVNLTDEELSKLEKFLKKKIYSSRSEAFRHAIELLFETGKLPKLREISNKLRKQFVHEFRPKEKEIKQNIIDYLRKYSGSTINEISVHTKLHRHTIRKYLSELIRAKMVRQKKVGVSVLSYLKVSWGIKND